MSALDQQSAQSGEYNTSQPWTTAAPARTRYKALPMQRMLIPLDMSDFGERAIPYALALANMTGASITLAHVASDSHAHAASMPVITAYLATIRDTLPATSHHVAMRIMRGKNVADTLCELTRLAQTDVVAVATHARQGVEQPSLGHVGDHLLRQGPSAVLIAPPALRPPATASSFRRILVPLDGSPLAEKALGPILTLAQNARQPLDIVLFYVGETREAQQAGLRYVGDTRAALLEEGLPEPVRVIAASVLGSPPGAIVGAATHGVALAPDASGPFDLVVMATHGRGGLQRLLYGSVATYVIPRLTQAALLIHPRPPANA